MTVFFQTSAEQMVNLENIHNDPVMTKRFQPNFEYKKNSASKQHMGTVQVVGDNDRLLTVLDTSLRELVFVGSVSDSTDPENNKKINFQQKDYAEQRPQVRICPVGTHCRKIHPMLRHNCQSMVLPYSSQFQVKRPVS
jgi:hypothetical protein